MAKRGRKLAQSHQLQVVEQGFELRLSDTEAMFLSLIRYTQISRQRVRLPLSKGALSRGGAGGSCAMTQGLMCGVR